jgi:hypothetical protein
MKKFFARLAIVGLVIFASVLLFATAIVTFFQEQLGQQFIAELNKQLASELSIESFRMQIIPTFPNVSATFQGVSLEDTRGARLLEARRVAFKFGLFSLFSANYIVKSIEVGEGVLNVHVDRRGQGNYQVFKATPETDKEKADKPFVISLETARLQDIELLYEDEQAKRSARVKVEDATFSGRFSSRDFALSSNARLQSGFIEQAGKRYLVDKHVKYQADIAVNMDDKHYALRDVTLSVENNQLRLRGYVRQEKEGTLYDLTVSSDDGKLEGVLQILPEEYRAYLGDFSSTGIFDFNLAVKGLATTKAGPAIDGYLSLSKGRLRSPRLAEDLRDVHFDIQFSNGAARNNRTSELIVKDFRGYFQRNSIEIKMRVDNFDDPKVDFALDGSIPMKAAYPFLREALADTRISGGEGEIALKGLRLRGRYKDMIDPARIERVEVAGQVSLEGLGLLIDKEKVRFTRGALVLRGNQTRIEELTFEGGDSELIFSGQAMNVLPVLLADSLNSRRASLRFNVNLRSPRLDLDRLQQLSPYAVQKETTSTLLVDSLKTKQIETRERIASLLNGIFDARIDRFQYGKMRVEDFNGKLQIASNQLDIAGSVRVMGGAMKLNGRLYFEREPHLEAQLVGEGIDAVEFFRQSDNFGQQVLVDKNVSGTLETRMIIAAYWDAQGHFLNDRLRVQAVLDIKQGELKGFKLLENFATFVKMKDLRHIRFVDMRNYLEIRDRTLYLPATFVQSNAINLTFSGQHDFDNTFRYNIKVNVGQVLVDRFRGYDPSLQPRPARQRGFFNLYYTVFGNLDNYDFKSARRLVRTDFERSEQRRRAIIAALESAFGKFDFEPEPFDWQDLNEPGAEEEYFDFEVLGKSANARN